MQRKPWLALQVLVSQEGLCSVGLADVLQASFLQGTSKNLIFIGPCIIVLVEE
jgi:hypothetical protein